MNSGLGVLALLGLSGLLAAAGCEQVADLGHNTAGSAGLGGDDGSGGADSGSGGTHSGVGDGCTPIDEYDTSFSGFSVDEVNLEIGSLQCETRLCLVNHFQGRVSCPYGNGLSSVNITKGETPPDCHIPGRTSPITVAVDPQVQQRQAQDAVYCSCRCDGPDANARYCACPSGFACVPLVDELPLDKNVEVAGSYCIREGTAYVKSEVDVTNTCRFSNMSCGGVTDGGEPQ